MFKHAIRLQIYIFPIRIKAASFNQIRSSTAVSRKTSFLKSFSCNPCTWRTHFILSSTVTLSIASLNMFSSSRSSQALFFLQQICLPEPRQVQLGYICSGNRRNSRSIFAAIWSAKYILYLYLCSFIIFNNSESV